MARQKPMKMSPGYRRDLEREATMDAKDARQGRPDGSQPGEKALEARLKRRGRSS